MNDIQAYLSSSSLAPYCATELATVFTTAKNLMDFFRIPLLRNSALRPAANVCQAAI